MCPVIKHGQEKATTVLGKKTALNIANFTEQAQGILLRARADADEILEQARREASEIVAASNADRLKIQEEAEIIKQRASEEGHAEGFEKGFADGQADGSEKAFEHAREHFEAQCGKLKEIFRSAVLQFDEARDEVVRQARAEMLQFAVEIAHRITGLQAAGDIEAARKILARVLSSAPCAKRLSLQVNAEQYDQLKVYAEEYIDAISVGAKVDIVADAELALGDVLLKTPEGGIDGRVSIQFDNIARAITGHEYIPMDFDEIEVGEVAESATLVDLSEGVEAESSEAAETEAANAAATAQQDENSDGEIVDAAADANSSEQPLDSEADLAAEAAAGSDDISEQLDEIDSVIDRTGELVDTLTEQIRQTGSLDAGSDGEAAAAADSSEQSQADAEKSAEAENSHSVSASDSGDKS